MLSAPGEELPPMPKVTVVMPTYNEAANLPPMAEALFALPLENLTMLVVDDNSPDGTGQIAEELATRYPGRIAVLHREAKGGLGPAYIAGFKQVLSATDADYLLQMDADFSHQPHYIPQMVAKLEEGHDVVIGSRLMPGGSVDESWPVYRKLLSWFANRVYVPTILGVPIYDSTGGFRLWRRQPLIGLDLDRMRSSGYVFQVEIAYVAHRLGFSAAEIPIHFPDRTRGASKMSTRIQIEAAVRVWQVLLRHRMLNPQMRRTEAYTS
jgi:dolichol-phosphate mannosyltransferase